MRRERALPQRRGISSTIRCRGWSASFCGRRRGVAAKPPQVTVSCLSGTRRWLSDRPRHPFGPLALGLVPYPALAGRGGSVSRRDHNKSLSETHPPLRRNQLCRSNPAKRQPLFGRRGSGGRGASLREAASPPSVSPPPSFRKGARGRGLFFRKDLSLASSQIPAPLSSRKLNMTTAMKRMLSRRSSIPP